MADCKIMYNKIRLRKVGKLDKLNELFTHKLIIPQIVKPSKIDKKI